MTAAATLPRLLSTASIGDYVRARLRAVLRSTMLKERIFLRRFLRWAKDEGAIAHVPEFPALPSKAPGVRSGPQRAKPVEVTPAEARAVLAALPVLSKSIGGRRWPVRARFSFAWETSLRPSTVSCVAEPLHWSRESPAVLELENADDKARFGRTLDLTPGAIAALKESAPAEGGVIFGDHNFDKRLKRAAIEVLGPFRGKRFAAYDFRHGRVQQIVDETGDLTAAAYVAGHKRLSTTDKYVRPSRRRAAEALRKVSGGRA